MNRTLSTSEAARVVGLGEARIREIVRSGLCRPARRGRRYAFSFQDLVVLRAAKGLLDARVPAARIRRALRALSLELPQGRTLAGLRIRADGRQLVVCDGSSTWRPDTGQLVLDFAVDDLARRASSRRDPDPAPAPDPGSRAARLAFERGLDLEDEDPKAACEAYRAALAADPELVDALVNLGRLTHEAGDPAEAARLYRRALECSPGDPVIHFNLALALEDGEGPEAAAASYERALALDPDFADAHFNLAGLCEELGRGADAIRHYGAYRRLTGESGG